MLFPSVCLYAGENSLKEVMSGSTWETGSLEANFDWEAGLYFGKIFNKDFKRSMKIVEEKENTITINVEGEILKIVVVDKENIELIDVNSFSKFNLTRKEIK